MYFYTKTQKINKYVIWEREILYGLDPIKIYKYLIRDSDGDLFEWKSYKIVISIVSKKNKFN